MGYLSQSNHIKAFHDPFQCSLQPVRVLQFCSSLFGILAMTTLIGSGKRPNISRLPFYQTHLQLSFFNFLPMDRTLNFHHVSTLLNQSGVAFGMIFL